ncbi:MAG: O-antigen ligase family protein [Planctomycetales bacterium]|nr:O-antigen ligase family protein [Planctomycetales bacterium]
MWLFVHRPFEIWPVLATIRIERTYMLFTIGCWLALGPRLPAPNRLHFRFVLFILVMIVSWLLSPYQAVGQKTVEDYLKYAVFYVLLVTSVRDERDLRTIVVGYVGVMTLFMAHSLREFYCGRAWYAQGILRMGAVGESFDANDFAGLIVCSLPFAWVMWREWTARWKRGLLLAYLGLGCYCIMLTGSRMGFCGLMLASVLACLISPKRWRLLALYPVFLAAAWMMLPEDRKDRYPTMIDPSKGPASATASAGNWRLGGFENSLPLFNERPLLGFGPMGFRAATRRGMPHNLYGQLLAELGLAGAVAFGLILWGVAQNAVEARRIVQAVGPPGDLPAWHTVAAMAATFLLLAFMGWGFNFLFWHVWLWFGGFQAVALFCLKQQAADAQLSEAVDLEPQPEILMSQHT